MTGGNMLGNHDVNDVCNVDGDADDDDDDDDSS